MNLDLENDLVNGLKENKLVQNFIKELSTNLEKNWQNKQENLKVDNSWCNLLADNLEIDNKKVISRYKDEMLLDRANILQNYAQKTKDEGEMYYIYNNSVNDGIDTYNLCICNPDKSNKVITKTLEELPNGSNLGSVLRKQGEKFVLDKEATEILQKQINSMVKEKIIKQNQYLENKRIEGHIYEADEKYLGRIWLYDLNNKNGGGIEEFEEIEFPKNLYETAKKGDLFIYKNGEYQKCPT